MRAVSPAGVTLDSTASLFTGLYPGNHRTGQHTQIVADGPRLAEIFREHSYRTGAFPTNPFISPGFGFEDGFDVFRSSEHRFKKGMDIKKFFDNHKHLPAYRIYLEFLLNSLDSNFPYHVGNALQFRFDMFTRNDNGGADATRKAVEFVESSNKPWFQYVHLNEAHMKNVDHLYSVPPNYLYKFTTRSEVNDTRVRRNLTGNYPEDAQSVHERLYDGAISYLDDLVGRLIDNIKAAGEWDETLFILTADHGELLGDRDRMGHGELAEPGIRVPLLIKPHAEMAIPDEDVEQRVSTLGVYTMLAELLGEDRAIAHADVKSVFEDQEPVLVQDYSSSWDWSSYQSDVEGKHALYLDGLKLIRRGGEVELYRTASDWQEFEPVSPDSTAFESMDKTLHDQLVGLGNDNDTTEVEIDGETATQLEELGYL